MNAHRGTGADTLWSAFQRTTDLSPDKMAITTSDGAFTFAEVGADARKLADALAAHGIDADAMVHTALPNSPAFLPSVLALRSIGATVGLLSARYRDAELRAVHHRVLPTAYLTTSRLAAVLARAIDVREELQLPQVAGQPGLSLLFPAEPGSRRETRKLAVVKFTSGSTGAPKGVGLTEANLIAEAHNVITALGITRSDRIVVPVPVSHSYGFDLGILPIAVAGAEAVVRRSFIPREVLADLAHPDTSLFLGVPSMYRVLAELETVDIPNLAHVRYLLSCTAPLMPELIQLCHERLRVSICQHYGSSETGAAANHFPNEVLNRPGSVGKAIAGVDVEVVNDDGTPAGPGEEGEILIRSQAVSSGYVTDEDSSPSPFTRGDEQSTEYRTGDIGVIDDEGFIFWRGRKDQVINVGGLKVYPSEVVQVLERCPGVGDARVVAAVDPLGEQVVHAFVTLSQSTREQDILAYCRHHLADYKVPRRIEIVEAISTPEATKMSALSEEN